ncbi:MAG: PD-(D/E)XK nuclease family protein, partial [Clostridia bacterium]|nr:PD-(D/E)XK nuclease family protein [Clostridia bacterium]
QREDVHSEPLVAPVQSALRCVAGGWRAESVLQLMKTGLLGFSAPSIARMENYIYTWKLNGRRLREEWTANPEGFSVQVDDTTRRTLQYLNILRHRLVTPLARLGDTLHDPVSGLDFAKAVYRYLSDSQVPRLVRLQVRRLEAAGDPLAAGRMERLWELLMELLDRFGAALRTTVLSAARFEELFPLAVASLDMGNIPQGLDAVQVGSAERMRFSAPRFVWVLGANEGVFPAYPATGGLFSDRERRQLAAAGVELSETGDREAVEERLFAYLALAAPSERLYISYLTGAGEVPPSALVETVRRLVPEHATLTGVEMPESAADAFHRLAIGFREPAGEEAALKAYFEADAAYTGRLSAMERAAAGAPFAFQSAAVAQDLFGRHLTLSATQVDTFYNCRFAYFCRYGLRVLPRRPAELDGLEFGNLAHYVMQTVLPRYVAANFKGVTRPVVVADTKAAVAQYIEEFMGGTEDKTERFLTLTARLSRTVESLLWQVVRELRQSRFTPVDYELPVGMEGGVPATTLTLPEGGDIRVIGKIDRVDVFKAGTTPYVRVVDYKTGHKDFRLSEVAAGINLQMLLYIFSLWDNGAARYGGDVTPAGVLYLPAKLPVVKVTADTEAEQRE